MATVGQRGKFAEGKVRAWMKIRSDAEAGFYFYRYPDARAGSLQVVPADFGTLHHGLASLLEVKEVHHDFRLPAKNFSADKVARMMKFCMAGGSGYVVVFHTPTKLWRLVPISVFSGERPASWDLSRFETFEKVDQVMFAIFGEKV